MAAELHRPPADQPVPLRQPPFQTAAAIAAVLAGQARVLYSSDAAEHHYEQLALAGAGLPGSQLAGEHEHAWRIARAIEALGGSSSSSEGVYRSSADVGHPSFQLGDCGSLPQQQQLDASATSSSPALDPAGVAYTPLAGSVAAAAGNSFAAAASPAVLFDPHAYYAAGFASAAAPSQPVVAAPAAAAASTVDYARAMQHHLSQQFAAASLQDGLGAGPYGAGPSGSTFAPSLPPLGIASSASHLPELSQHALAPLPPSSSSSAAAAAAVTAAAGPPPLSAYANAGFSSFLANSAMTPLTVPGAAIAPPHQQQQQQQQQGPAPSIAPPNGSGGGPLPESSLGAPYTCCDSPPSYDSPPPEAGPSSVGGPGGMSRAFSVPAGINPEAAAAHHAWNASLNALDPEKKFICPMPSCGRGFKRIFNLKAHMNSHAPEGGKRFPCTVDGCPKGFSRKHDMERHRTAAHPDGVLVDESTTVEGRGRRPAPPKDASRSKTL